MFVSLTFLKDSVAAAGTALLLGAAAMSSQQDPVAASAPPQVQGEPRIIEVVAKRFAFEPSRIEAVQGERLTLVVKSDDGVHGIEIKKFKINKKIPRGGEPVTIEFVAGSAGEFPVLCSEYCGKQHDAMRGTLIVIAK